MSQRFNLYFLMATAVLDLHLEKLPAEIKGLHGYSSALILLRFKNRPVGKITIPVDGGCLYLEDHQNKIIDAGGISLWQAWMDDFLQLKEDGPGENNLPTATIAICTRDRTEDLRRCLNAIINLPDDGQEIIVVDNCPSTDETRQLVLAHKHIRYIIENSPGLNCARNRALQEAKSEIIAFTDDDATPDTGWLRALLRNFKDPMVACVTGMTMPLELETDGQEAFENYNSFGKGFQRKVHSQINRNPLNTGAVGAGANMAIRRNIINEVGLFDEALDAGTPTQSGGDHEYYARILLAGFKIVYDPAALNWHRHRRTLEETRRAIKGYGIGVYAFWTRCLLVEKEISILKFPLRWLLSVQLPDLARSILRARNSKPLDLVIAELVGCAVGPLAYIKSRKRVRKRQKQSTWKKAL
jgi:glycosyltransferase involved in cell wall biosynthesis